jgi:hypothetical protein
MIKLFITLLLIIALLVISWQFFVKNQIYSDKDPKQEPNSQKKVQFADNVESFTIFKKDNVSNNLEKIYKQVNPANFYTQDYNTPNFITDVMDLRKYYDYDLPAKSQKEQEPAILAVPENGEMRRKTEADNFPWLEGPDKNEKKNVMESDYWSYKDELPMNGGSFNGIVGYQNMGDSFSFFNQYKSVDEIHPKLTDDLRSGMGTPQKEKYQYDMSQI